jgi:hypothetical protein
LQVVHNPSWLTPYFSCVMVAAGLLWQFLSHLIPFLKRRMAGSGGAGVTPANGAVRGNSGRRDANAPRKEKKKP